MRRALATYLAFQFATGHTLPFPESIQANYAALLAALGRSEAETAAAIAAVRRAAGLPAGSGLGSAPVSARTSAPIGHGRRRRWPEQSRPCRPTAAAPAAASPLRGPRASNRDRERMLESRRHTPQLQASSWPETRLVLSVPALVPPNPRLGQRPGARAPGPGEREGPQERGNADASRWTQNTQMIRDSTLPSANDWPTAGAGICENLRASAAKFCGP
jgi:hypothetical protein